MLSRALTPEQAAVIKATVPVLAQYGEAITTRFYHDLFEELPALKNVFNNTHQATGHQARALAGALYAYAANIDELGNLSAALELICHKHASLYIQPQHYDIVGEHLLKTIKAVLGDAATPEIMNAWAAAYWQLADIMIGKEAGLYEKANGWTDWKDFKIARIEKEASDITSFYLEPVDSSLKKLPLFKPGQYISVNIFVDELDGGVWQARQYSLSDAPGKDYYRISVKKEPALEIGDPKSMTHPGYVSNILHEKKNVGDIVRVSHPFGDFFLEQKEGDESPVVLISAGVGLTCLMSILNTLTEKPSTQSISWIHGARSANARAFKAHTDELAASNKNLRTVLFSSSPAAEEVEGQHFHVRGRLNLERLTAEDLYTNNDKTQYFVCGPTQFMLEIEEKLKIFGVPSERVKMELFGTGGVPRV